MKIADYLHKVWLVSIRKPRPALAMESRVQRRPARLPPGELRRLLECGL